MSEKRNWIGVPSADRPACSTPEKHRLAAIFPGTRGRRLIVCQDCGWPRREGEDARIGNVSRYFSGLSWCYRCETTWDFVEGHDTKYSESSALFPLCEQCWLELTPAERLPFYRILWDAWNRSAAHYGYSIDAKWEDIERAVMEEVSVQSPGKDDPSTSGSQGGQS